MHYSTRQFRQINRKRKCGIKFRETRYQLPTISFWCGHSVFTPPAISNDTCEKLSSRETFADLVARISIGTGHVGSFL